MIIRNVTLSDLDRMCTIENETFPPEEAAPREKYEYRIRNYSDYIFCAELEEDELLPEDRGAGKKIVSFLCGRPVGETKIKDRMYENTIDDGKVFALLSVGTLPGYQNMGIAGKLIRHAIDSSQKMGMDMMILACKSFRKPFYESFGFIPCGISESTHGGAEWYDMRLEL